MTRDAGERKGDTANHKQRDHLSQTAILHTEKSLYSGLPENPNVGWGLACSALWHHKYYYGVLKNATHGNQESCHGFSTATTGIT
jgi:hypothetical protein